MNYRLSTALSRVSMLWRRRLPVLLAIGLGLSFSLAAFWAVRCWEGRDIAKAFRIAADDRATAVKGTFQTEVSMLELIRSSLISDGRILRDEFQEILAPFHSRDHSIQAVQWVPRVADNRRHEYEAAARRDGIAGFQITEKNRNGQIVPSPQRPEYFPIYFTGPQPGDKTIFGYDVASEPTRLEALSLARDTGQTVASGRIALIEKTATNEGFLVCLPVYEKGRPTEATTERRQHLLGFVLGVFRPDEMIESALKQLHPEGIDVCLYDPTASIDGRPFHFHASRTRRQATDPANPDRLYDPSQMSYAVKLDVAGHPWTIVCLPTPGFVAAHRSWSPWAVLAAGLALTALLAAYISVSVARRASVEESLVQKRRYAGELEQKVRAQTAHIRRAQEEVIHRLVAVSQSRDRQTGMHARRVGFFSEVLAKAAGWSAAQTDCIRLAAPMHDVGKISIPDAVLRKPGAPTPDELETLKTHTLIGARMLDGSNVPLLDMAREIALCHHERWDGQGYPHRLAGQLIPESARIVAIVDAYDALTHDRVYHSAISEEEALALLQQGSGMQFDPYLLAHFFAHLTEIRRIARENHDEQDVESSNSSDAPAWQGVELATAGSSYSATTAMPAV
jgi:HD-GYP domain-containing protein (c-di-GMP phosphodiesterase class II)/CHASE1-domain containing sensor protein